jgi:hypothetical protein
MKPLFRPLLDHHDRGISPFTLANSSFVNLVFIFRSSSSTTNPVCESRVDLLVCSLPLHRHSYIGFILAFASSIHNKQPGNDEDSEKRAIEDLPVVSSVCFHAGHKTHKSDVYVNLRCDCGAFQVERESQLLV